MDFGSIGSSEGDILRKYKLYLEALSTGHYAKAIDVFLLMMPEVPAAQLTPMKEDLQRALHSWGNRCTVKELPYTEKSASYVSDAMTKIMANFGANINWSFFKMLRGWMTMDTSLRELIPNANLTELMQAYTRQNRKREFSRLLYQLPGDILKLQNLIDYPTELAERAIYKGAMIRRVAQVFEGATTRISRLMSLVFKLTSNLGFLLFLFVGLGFVSQHAAPGYFTGDNSLGVLLSKFPKLDMQVWLLLLTSFFYSSVSLLRLSRRMGKEE